MMMNWKFLVKCNSFLLSPLTKILIFVNINQQVMKILLAVFIGLFSLQASAQWYPKMPWQKTLERSPQLNQPFFTNQITPETTSTSTSFINFKTDLGRSRYSINAEEAFIMKNLRHSARYGPAAMRIQFDNLVNFYFSQKRFSEAKWYVLRSNAISRQEKNYTNVVGSLVVLADVKSSLGDFIQANADLSEAKVIASSHSMTLDLLLIEQHSKQIRLNKETGLKPENHYSDIL